MAVIDDNALVLHYYGEDASPQERERIAHALTDSSELRARYARLCATLDAASLPPAAIPDGDFNDRVWRNFEARLAADPAAPESAKAPLPVGDRLGRGSAEARTSHPSRDVTRGSLPATRTTARRHRPRWRLATSIAASVLLILTTGFLAGRLSAPDEVAPSIALAPPATDPQLATRILDAYVAAHLRETEGVILTALNSDSPDLAAGNADLAAALIDSNRLYTQAAARAGNARLADFLRQMEPVLIELANPPRNGGIEVRDGLRDYVRESDLLFQVRATEGALASRQQRT
jgi:hypothetical protein